MPGDVDKFVGIESGLTVGNVHVVVGVFGVAGASEFDKSVTGSREWFVERSLFDGIGLEGGRIVRRAQKRWENQGGAGSPSSSVPDRKNRTS